MRGTGKIARSRRIVAIAAPLSVISSAVFGSVLVAAPAQASCSGRGVASTDTFFVNGTAVAREATQYASTCDGDNFYAGRLQDPVTDGSCSYAVYIDAGVTSTQGVSCTTGGWANYSFRDRNGDSSATLRLRVSYATGPGLPTWGF